MLFRSKADERVQIGFWFSNGKERFTSFAKYLWLSSIHRLSLGHWGSQPVMVTAYAHDTSDFEWRRAMDKFPVLMEF